jgi:hypothetical protein
MSSDRKYARLDFTLKLLAAGVAGGSLIVPMLIVSIHLSLRKSLIFCTYFVLAFLLGAVWKSTMKREDIGAAAAAYTTVGVLVGVNTSRTTH